MPGEVAIKRCKKLYFRGVKATTTEHELRTHFSAFGQIVKVYLIFNPHTGKSKSFGYVEFTTVEEAESALQFLNHTLSGKLFFVERHRNSFAIQPPRKRKNIVHLSKKAADKRAWRAQVQREALIAQNRCSGLTPRADYPLENKFDRPVFTPVKSYRTSQLNTENSLKSILIRQKLSESHPSHQVMSSFGEYYQHIKSLNATVLNHEPSNCRFNNESEYHRLKRIERTTSCILSFQRLEKHAS